ncbi:aspartate ammonia-lyase [Synechococcus sp. H55.11]|uniref:aspartate ammonia-lyase n=1 Tax=Synechococcus sp. H55.11 TaxID=2967121 RepID=UPI0039C49DEF
MVPETTPPQVRCERDSMGERQLPQSVYYGIQTARALENFPISGLRPLPEYVEACVLIKKAAAEVNGELGCIPAEVAKAIVQAADEILQGSLRDQFVVDVYQAGAGTSHHMNVNEVLANRALEILGEPKGRYERVSPNDHVNYGQSTNDVIPTAIRLAALSRVRRDLLVTLDNLVAALEQKAQEFRGILKAGRTHLQDAVPVRLGDSFGAYAAIFAQHRRWIEEASQALCSLGLGGSAVGTGLNTPPQYRQQVVQRLADYTQLPLTPAPHPMAAMQSMAPFVHLSGSLRNLAQDGIKLANDLRLMDSGPKTGLKEIQLPPVQPGSSIMPGKYNPVLAEMLNMVCFQVIGLDTAITLCAQAGQFELNVMMPLIAYDLLHSLQILNNSLRVFAERCIQGIIPYPERCRSYAEGTLALVTALNPYIGYLQAAEIAKLSLETGKPIRQILLERNLMSPEQVAKVLDLEAMSQMQS